MNHLSLIRGIHIVKHSVSLYVGESTNLFAPIEHLTLPLFIVYNHANPIRICPTGVA